MLRGKPKGIQRKQAMHADTFFDKAAWSEQGKFVEYKERSLIAHIHSVLVLCSSEKCQNYSFDWSDIHESIITLVKDAISQLDSTVFTRCAEVLDWVRDGKPVADPMGSAILWMIRVLCNEKNAQRKNEGVSLENSTITVDEILSKLVDLCPDIPAADAKDVRQVMLGLGITQKGIAKLSVQMLNEDTTRYLEKNCKRLDVTSTSKPSKNEVKQKASKTGTKKTKSAHQRKRKQ